MKLGKSESINKIFFSLAFTVVFFISGAFAPGIGADNKGFICADLLFAMSIVAGVLYENTVSASVIALIFGVISDVFITPPMHLSPLLFFLAAYFVSRLAGVFTAVNAVSATVASIPFFLVRAVVGTVYILSENDETELVSVIGQTILPELAVNVASVFVVYILVSFLYKKVKKRFYV